MSGTVRRGQLPAEREGLGSGYEAETLDIERQPPFVGRPHDRVEDATVVCVTDECWEQRVFPVTRGLRCRRRGTEPNLFCDSAVSNFKRPHEYLLVGRIPRSSEGMVLHGGLLAGEYERG